MNLTIPALASFDADHTGFEGLGVDGMSAGGTLTTTGLFSTSITQLILRETGKITFDASYNDTGVALSGGIVGDATANGLTVAAGATLKTNVDMGDGFDTVTVAAGGTIDVDDIILGEGGNTLTNSGSITVDTTTITGGAGVDTITNNS